MRADPFPPLARLPLLCPSFHRGSAGGEGTFSFWSTPFTAAKGPAAAPAADDFSCWIFAKGSAPLTAASESMAKRRASGEQLQLDC